MPARKTKKATTTRSRSQVKARGASGAKAPAPRARRAELSKSPTPSKGRKTKGSTSKSAKKQTRTKTELLSLADEILAEDIRSSRTPKQPARSKAQTSNHRNFFTVREDWLILEHIKANPEEKITYAASVIAEELEGRSKESIRDRIKRYLSKISAGDQRKIQFAAKRTPGHHAHFTTDKSGGNRKAIKEITSSDPGLITGAGKSAPKSRSGSRSASRPAPKLLTKRTPRSGASQKKFDLLPVEEEEEPITGPIDLNELVVDTRSRSIGRNSVRGLTPELTYSSKNQKRGTSLLIDPSKAKIISPGASKSIFNLVHSLTRVPQNNAPIESKISEFMEQLRSRDPEDIRANAMLLSEIIKSFSISFDVDVKDIIGQLSKQRGLVNIGKMRNNLFTSLR